MKTDPTNSTDAGATARDNAKDNAKDNASARAVISPNVNARASVETDISISTGTSHDATAATALYSVAQIRAIEQAVQATLPAHMLMARAGVAAAELARTMLGGGAGAAGAAGANGAESAAPAPASTPILVAAGPGNNGGDAFECGARLAADGYAVTCLVPQSPTSPSADYLLALQRLQAQGVPCIDVSALPLAGAPPWALVIDGLFGIGLTRPLDGVWRVVIDALNAIDAPVLALDVPSGLDADTGAIPGAVRSGACIRATATLSFIGDKPGLHSGEGRDHAGHVSVAALGIDPVLLPPARAHLSTPAQFAPLLQPRRQNSHKGSFGDVQIIGGGAGMGGAAILAGHAALKMGAGRVLLGFADAHAMPHCIDSHPELMCRDAATLDPVGATLVVGPGLGQSAEARALVRGALASQAALVLDADALNLVAVDASLQQALAARARRGAVTILTPHPLEAGRLLSIGAGQVQADRLHAAHTLAARYRAVIILKGSGTVIADGEALLINSTGNPALATGGTGDVLSGMCGALLAQRWPAAQAAAAAVWIHGRAADLLVQQGTGPVGVSASEIIDGARQVLNQLISQQRPAWRA